MYINIQHRHIYNFHNEEDLQKEVVKYLQTTDLLFSCQGLEQMLDTDNKRINAKKLGYKNGMPDIIIYSPNNTYNGLALELKAPNGFGDMSKAQVEVLDQLERESDYFCLASNDFAEIVEIVTKYIHDVLCRKEF